MDYDTWLHNEIVKTRNKDKYKQLKRYIKNIKEYIGTDSQDNVIFNMMLASGCHDIEHNTNTQDILVQYLKRYGLWEATKQ